MSPVQVDCHLCTWACTQPDSLEALRGYQRHMQLLHGNPPPSDDSILAGILRRLLAEPLDVGLYRSAGAYKLWTRHEAALSDAETAAVRRVLEQ